MTNLFVLPWCARLAAHAQAKKGKFLLAVQNLIDKSAKCPYKIKSATNNFYPDNAKRKIVVTFVGIIETYFLSIGCLKSSGLE